ncbi:MAG: ABC transporter ATP-binding protein [Planctomycetota bacterium]
MKEPNPQPPVDIRLLALDRGARAVLRGLNWTVPRGSATGLLGRNGSGKSSLMHAMLGLSVDFTSDACMTLGQNAKCLDDDALERIGFVDQHYELIDWLRVDEHVHYVERMRARWDVSLQDRLLDAFELRELAGLKVEALSPGARQRLAVMLALCHRPDLLVLDEPVSAQDPIFRRVMLDALRERVIEDGTTLILSSHVLRDVEAVVDRVAVLHGGRIAIDEELDVLKESYQQWVVVGTSISDEDLAQLSYVVTSERVSGALILHVRGGEAERRELEARFSVSVQVRSLDLERLFPVLVGAEAEVAGS